MFIDTCICEPIVIYSNSRLGYQQRGQLFCAYFKDSIRKKREGVFLSLPYDGELFDFFDVNDKR